MFMVFGAPNFFFKKLYEDLQNELDYHHLHSHHFSNAYFLIGMPFFRNYPKSLLFCVLYTMDLPSQSTQKFFSKKLYENLCNEFGN